MPGRRRRRGVGPGGRPAFRFARPV